MQHIDKINIKQNIISQLSKMYGKQITQANAMEVYMALSVTLKEMITEKWLKTKLLYETNDVKQVYYLSMEFLLGRILGNNIMNLGLSPMIKEILNEFNIDVNMIENIENDIGLGNGGLGRLAACFLDSIATLQLPGHGACIKYKYGLFKQSIKSGFQVESPDEWLDTGEIWLTKDEVNSVIVSISNWQIKALPYDMPIIGYGNNTVNTLKLWDALPMNGEHNPYTNITDYLYPPDNHHEGKKLRLIQEYFFVSATIQYVVNNFYRKHKTFELFPDKIQFQLNDTHPAVAVAELMRILMDIHLLGWDEAWDITVHTCSYTNHTIMSEALEKWNVDLFRELLPRIYEIIEEINRRFCKNLINAEFNQEIINKLAIVGNGEVRMANLSIVSCHSINGVSTLHTNILKNQELKEFYQLYPQKFNNKTNGITQRRWLLKSNPELSSLITRLIGSEWIINLHQLKQLEKYIGHNDFTQEIRTIKYNNKVKLAKYIEDTTTIRVDPNSIFDVQVKRLHEYKRQLLNVLHILYLYNKIKENPNLDMVSRTFIFGAKSAPAYYRAKLIIKLINCVADVINHDDSIHGKIRVVFLENYRVSLAEKIFPASDVSEQISTASMEASGTGNMKFMLNGAITIGTLDGANVEIVEKAGIENEFIFGLSSTEVMNYQKYGGYDPKNIFYNDSVIRKIMIQLIDGTVNANCSLFAEIFDSLLNIDKYFILRDFNSYVQTQQLLENTYKNQDKWINMSIKNIANSGYFSSDRTITEYADEIWKLHKICV